MTILADRPQQVEAAASPYVGLTFYTAKDAGLFFGREAERKVLMSNLRASRLTLLYAGSGVGKSSLLRAGVAARLTELAERSVRELGTPRYVPVVFSSWRDDPTADLMAEIRKAASPYVTPESLDEVEHERLLDLLSAASAAANATLLVILDQFEEYFLYRSRESVPGRFAEELAACINRGDLRANFLISIREDAYAGLGDLFHGRIDNVYGNYLHLENLNRTSARAAIVKPIARFNELHEGEEPVELEPALVDAVLLQLSASAQFGSDQTGKGRLNGGDGVPRMDEPIAAPYLQLVMKRLWDEREEGSRKLQLSSLEKLGGARTIVTTHVDRALSDLSPEERDTALDIFRHLVTPSGTKIALEAKDLTEYTSHSESEIEALLERLASSDTRILRPVPPAPGGDGGTRFEISHDLLAPAILDWRTRQQAVHLEREKRAAEAQAAKEQRRAQIFRGLAIATGALLIASIGLVVAALILRANAERDKQIAQSRHLAASAEATLAQDPQLATRLSLQALRARDTPEAESALRDSLPQFQLLATLSPPSPQRAAMFSVDASRILTASADGAIRIWDAGSHQLIATFPGFGALNSAALNRSGTEIVTANNDGTARIINAQTGKLLGLLAVPGGYAISSAAFSPNGRLIVTAGADGIARVWDAASGQQRVKMGASGTGNILVAAQFSPDGRRVVTASSDGTARLWDAASGRPLGSLSSGLGLLTASFSPDGTKVVTGGAGGTASIWNAATNQRLGQVTPAGGKYMVWTAAFSPNGKHLVTGGGDGVVRVWDVATHKLLRSLGRPGTDTIVAASYSPDGKSIVTASAGGIVAVWGDSGNHPIAVLHSPASSNRLDSVAFSRDGTLAVTGSHYGVATIWKGSARNGSSTLTWRPLNVISIPAGDAVNGVALSPHADLIATANQSGNLYVWRVPDGLLVGGSSVSSQPLHSVQFDPANPNRVLTAGDDGAAHIFDVTTQSEVGQGMAPSSEAMEDAAFSPNGKLIATASDDGYARVWSASTQKQIGDKFGDGPPGFLTSVTFNPNSSKVMTTNSSGYAEIFDASTPQHAYDTEVPQQAGSQLNSAAFSPVGGLVFTGGTDGTARMWDPTSQTQLLSFAGHNAPITGLAVNAAGTRLITASGDGTARIWSTQPIELRALLPGSTDLNTVVYDPKNPDVLATVSTSGTITLWDPQTGTRLKVLSQSTSGNGYATATFSHDGTRLLATGGDQRAHVWDVTNPRQPRLLGVFDLNQHAACTDANSNTAAGINDVAFSQHDDYVATSNEDGTACVWNATTYAPAPGPDGRGVMKLTEPMGASGGVSGTSGIGASAMTAASFSPDGRQLLTSSSDGTARVWNLSTGVVTRVLLEPTGDTLNYAWFSPNGRFVLTSSNDGTSRIWDVAAAQVVHVLTQPDRLQVNDATFSPNGRFVVTCSGSASIWNAGTGQLLATVHGYDNDVYDCQFNRDGSRVALAGVGGKTAIFSTQLDGSIKQLEQIARQRLNGS